MRGMGLDYGDKTIGVAVSDPFMMTAQGLETIIRTSPEEYKKSLSRLAAIISEYGVEWIVLGYPKNMNDTEGPRCVKTKEFQLRLEKRFSIPVLLWDERLSTSAVEQVLISGSVRRDKRKKVIDKMAAVFILQGYLDAQNLKKERENHE